jgi:hypothetical protein
LDPNFTSHKKGVEHNNKACIFIWHWQWSS